MKLEIILPINFRYRYRRFDLQLAVYTRKYFDLLARFTEKYML